MNKHYALLFFCFFYFFNASAQCPTGDIQLSSQALLDDFVSQHANCSTIDANLTLNGSISDLSGLSFLEHISGFLNIENTNTLTSLNGFQNLEFIGTGLRIYNANGLVDLVGLDGAKLQRINGSVFIERNDNLLNINALNGLEQTGMIKLEFNPLLSSLSGLDQLQLIEGNLELKNNAVLSDCSLVCDLKQNCAIEGMIIIQNNAILCSSLTEVNILCQANTCPIGDYDLRTQVEVDAFINTFFSCNNLDGELKITGDAITDISGFNFLTNITGSLIIQVNNTLTDLNGFQNLNQLGSLVITNLTNITDLTGINASLLEQIDGNLIINSNSNLNNLDALTGLKRVGALSITSNGALVDISGLSDLRYINNGMGIQSNAVLTNLVGTEQIQFIGGGLSITNNPQLTDCSSLCQLLHSESITGTISIFNNPALCNQTGIEGSCTPNTCSIGTININSQSQLDDFVVNNNSCDSLSGNISIAGVINDLSGLSFLKYLSGNLSISFTAGISTLNGIEGIEIQGSLKINNNVDLTSLSGIHPISIGKDLIIHSNAQLVNLNGLQSVTKLDGNLDIYNNAVLTNLDSLAGLSVVIGFVEIRNTALINLNGLAQIGSIKGKLTIQDNPNLVDCSGICDLINNDNVGGEIKILSNPSPCSSVSEIELICTNETCPSGDIILASQAEVIAFINAFSGCDSLMGSLLIGGTITDLSGLTFLNYVKGDLTIISANNLTTLTGLDGLTKVNGDVILTSNSALNNLNGLEQLSHIEGSLSLQGNNILNNLTGLDGLVYIGDDLQVESNRLLANLDGLNQLAIVSRNLNVLNNDNLINVNGIANLTNVYGDLTIFSNPSLTDCSALCGILADEIISGNISISQNPGGCSSINELNILCSTTNCPIDDVFLGSQEEVDAFVATFPTCDSILGNLNITSFLRPITDLSGLSFLKYIQGNLSIASLPQLTSLSGMEGLTEIGGDLVIFSNTNLASIAALGQLATVGGSIQIEKNRSLVNLEGLNQINNLQANLTIKSNDDLADLSACDQIVYVGGDLTISSNQSLASLTGLENITNVDGNLSITSNTILTDCSAICAIINSNGVTGNLTILSNPSECSTNTEVTTLCANACPEGDIILSTQAEVNAFANSFPGCDSLLGSLTIGGGSLVIDISGLSFLKYISGDLTIRFNYELTSLTGLEGIEEIGGNLKIEQNRFIDSLIQFSQLNSVGGDLSISFNDSLKSLIGLEQLTTIGKDLKINNNSALADCESICALIQSNNIVGLINIYSNPTGCNTIDELLAGCIYGGGTSALILNNLPSTIEESDTLRFEIAVDVPPMDTLLINVFSSDFEKIPVSTPIKLLPGEVSIPLVIPLPNDDLAEDVEEITLTAGANFLSAAIDSFLLTDNADIPGIFFEVFQDTVSESAGVFALQGILIRMGDDGSELKIELTTDDPLAVYLPAGITLASGQSEKVFDFGVFENTQVDGFRTQSITATVLLASCNCPAPLNSTGSQSQQIVIIDNDGPSLSLTADRLSLPEGQNGAGILTISRNTPTDIDLSIALSVNDTSELSLPIEVLLPAGSASIQIPIDTKSDAISDGNQQVSIQANATNFSPGIISVIVTDINKPDFQISEVLLTSTDLAANSPFPFRIFVTNTGFSAAPSGAQFTGYLSTDQFIDAADFSIGSFVTEVAIEVGDTIEMADLGISPIQAKNYYLLFQINGDEAFTELLYLNNRSAPLEVNIAPDYTGTAVIDDSIFHKSAIIPIYGQAIKPNGEPVPNADLEVFINNGIVERVLPVSTDAFGNYSLDFEPLENEAGHFEVGAVFPDQLDRIAQDSFDILGIEFNEGNVIDWEVILGDTMSGSFQVRNLSNLPLTNVRVEVLSLPTGCSLQFDTIPLLLGKETLDINYEILGDSISPDFSFQPIVLAISSETIALEEITAYYYCQSQQAYLRGSISSIQTTVSKDHPRFFEFQVYNDGIGESQEIEVAIPEVDWMRLVTPRLLPSLSEGDTALIIFEIIPTENLPLNIAARGNIVINATNGNFLDLPYSIKKVSNTKGGIIVDVIDQYTYFTEEAPHVANAEVKITDYFTGEIFAQGLTDTSGLIIIDSLPEGRLRMVVQAAKHKSYDGFVDIAPGGVLKEVIFLRFQAITFSWEVIPTTIEDEYEINLKMDFETNVPVPVVVIDMPDSMPALVGEETFSFFITLTNKGLITANDVELNLPTDPEYEFVLDYKPLNIFAQQVVQVPVKLKRKDNVTAFNSETGQNYIDLASDKLQIKLPPALARNGVSELKGECKDVAFSVYWYKCGENGIYEKTADIFDWPRESCNGAILVGEGLDGFAPRGGGGGGDAKGGKGEKDCKGPCPPQPPEEEDEEDRFPDIGFVDCECNDCIKHLLNAAQSCLRSTIVKKDPISIILCIADITKSAINCGWIPGIGISFLNNAASARNSANSFPVLLQQPMDDLYVVLEANKAVVQKNEAYYGTLFENDNFEEFFILTNSYIEEELNINPVDSSYILEQMSTFDIASIEISSFINRWNETVKAWAEGVFSPNATYPDIIDKGIIDEYNAIINFAGNYVDQRGFQTLEELTESARLDIIKFSQPPTDPTKETAFNPVCASVSINISQRLTLTREAFEGTLNIYNGHPTDDLQNLSLNLEILDENGVLSNDLFEIETQSLSVLTGIDGTGSLTAETDGSANILFIPERGAAPQLPTSYSFGGTISYLDPFSELMVTLPLIPVTLEVNPSPDLFLHYFMQRDILGDDPLTAVVEPIIPADLAVMIENNGFGVAQKVSIASAQPEIIDNEKGLAVNFSLTGSKLQGQEANLGLNTIDFGNIAAMNTKVGQWYFTSDLLGHFINYETELVHLDSRGNPELSLVSGIALHELIRSMSVYGAIDDEVDDFLVNEIPDEADMPDAIYLSQGNLIYDVFPAISGVFTGDIKAPGNTTTVTVDAFATGWNYIKLDDPGAGQFKIISVTRDDGQEIPLKNVWLSHVTIPDTQVPVYENKFHIVDEFANTDPTAYTVVWSPLDPNPPAIVDISGHPSSLSASQVSTLTVTFSEAIDPTTFTIDDLMLKFQGGPNIIDNSVGISQIDPLTFEIDLSAITVENGVYTFIAQAAGIQDLSGVNGLVGEQISWTQILSVPVVQEFIGLPTNNIGTAIDTMQLLFNLPIDLNTLTNNKFTISLGDSTLNGTIFIDPVPGNNQLFRLSGLGQILMQDGVYELSIDLPNIQSTSGVFGITPQSLFLTLDSQAPQLLDLVQMTVGGLDEQHFTGVSLNFNEAIQPLDSLAITLYQNGLVLNTSPTEIKEITSDWYEVKWPILLSYPEGDYNFSIDLSKVSDLAGNIGSGIDSINWTVDRTTELVINNLAIAPDMGFSDMDGITATKDLTVSFSINEAARNINFYQNDNGILTLLKTINSAPAGPVSASITLNTGGQTGITINLEDLQGNEVESNLAIYIDESALLAEWNFPANQQLSTHPNSIELKFSDPLLNATPFPDSAIHLLRNGQVLLVNLMVNPFTDTTFLITGLADVSLLPGNYELSIDLSLFQKYTSGISGKEVIYTAWEIIDQNIAPIANAGLDTTLTQITTFKLDATQSFDPDGDTLFYQWYPPANVQLSNGAIAQPTFVVSGTDQGSIYNFLLSVSDGKSFNTDVVEVQITLNEDTITIQQPSPDTVFCNNDSLTIAWEIFGAVTEVDILLSDVGGQNFPVTIANNATINESPLNFPLTGLEGTEFLIRVEDASLGGFARLSDTFAIETCTCEPPIISLSNDTTIYLGDTVQLFANGGIEYQWTPTEGLSADNIPNPLAFPIIGTKYFVEVKDEEDCTNLDSLQIVVVPKPPCLGIGDVDEDGICADEDCDDTDPVIGRIGDSCDDGNPLTSNDLLDENCDCIGETVDPTTCQVSVSVQEDTIFVAGLIQPINKLDIYDENWTQVVFGCGYTNCNEMEYKAGLPVGKYHVKIQSWTAGWQMSVCNTIIDVEIFDDSPPPLCDPEIIVGNDYILVNGLNEAIVKLDIYNGAWSQVLFTCGYEDCNSSEIFENLSPGTYHVKILSWTAGYQTLVCNIIQSVIIGTNDCSEDRLVFNIDSIPSETYQTSDRIESQGVVKEGGNVTFSAKQEILLMDGFHAKAGSDFSAKIEDCSLSEFTEFPTEIKTNSIAIPINVDLKIAPNPFKEETTISYQLDQPLQRVQLSIFNMTGQLQTTLIPDQVQTKGLYSLNYQPKDLSPGLYYVYLQVEGEVFTKKIILIR